MSILEELGIEAISPIKGFRVMEWLSALRNANYELSVKDPEAYRKKLAEKEQFCLHSDV